MEVKRQHLASGLTSLSSQARLASVRVYARGKFCGNLNRAREFTNTIKNNKIRE